MGHRAVSFVRFLATQTPPPSAPNRRRSLSFCGEEVSPQSASLPSVKAVSVAASLPGCCHEFARLSITLLPTCSLNLQPLSLSSFLLSFRSGPTIKFRLELRRQLYTRAPCNRPKCLHDCQTRMRQLSGSSTTRRQSRALGPAAFFRTFCLPTSNNISYHRACLQT